jgi:hypothetical protein
MEMLLKAMIEPALRRVGSILGAYTATLSLESGETATLQAAIPIVLGVAVDLIHSQLAERLGWKR